jgi:hypothetical protein
MKYIFCRFVFKKNYNGVIIIRCLILSSFLFAVREIAVRGGLL